MTSAATRCGERAQAKGYPTAEPVTTDPGELAAVDLGENFLVTGGYYCGSGDPRLEVGPAELLLHIDSSLACEAPTPVSSIFVVPRSLTDGTFTLGTVELGGEPGDPIVVENWERIEDPDT